MDVASDGLATNVFFAAVRGVDVAACSGTGLTDVALAGGGMGGSVLASFFLPSSVSSTPLVVPTREHLETHHWSF